MTIEITKPGTDSYRGRCSNCGAEFKYGRDDLQTKMFSSAIQYIRCPCCGHVLIHWGVDGTRIGVDR